MMRHILNTGILFSVLGFGHLFAGDLTLYSHRHYESDDALFQKFTEESGIKVNVVKAKADELIERLKAEGENSPADLFMTADAGNLQRAKSQGVLQTISSEVLDAAIPENLRDPDGEWYGITQRARVLVYAKDRNKPEDFSSYEDLADPKWRGQILVRSSSNIYNQSLMASIIAAHGEEKAEEWAAAVRKNMARPPQGSDRDQMRAVAAGLGDVAIVNTYYLGLLVNSDDPKDQEVGNSVAIFFPNQAEGDRGTHVNISGAGVTKYSKNVKEATQLLEFLVSETAQQSFPEETSEYPVVSSVESSDLLQEWGTFRADSLSLATLGDLNANAVEVFNKAGWE